MPLDQFLEAARDVVGILRGMWRAEREPQKRLLLEEAGRDIRAAIAVAAAHAADSPEYRAAMAKADAALNAVANSLHFVAPLEPVLGAAAGHLRRVRSHCRRSSRPDG